MLLHMVHFDLFFAPILTQKMTCFLQIVMLNELVLTNEFFNLYW